MLKRPKQNLIHKLNKYIILKLGIYLGLDDSGGGDDLYTIPPPMT
ncbi:protein of unknown function [Enterobacter cancerogenus]|nr:protein of unknown function [Enterobacter cancerogenus]